MARARPRRRSPDPRGAADRRADGTLTPLGLPRGTLEAFPRRDVRWPLHRIHEADRDPRWFSSDGRGRFDLPERGTCYLAEKPLGAFIEVFRGTGPVSAQVVAARALTTIRSSRRLTIADCTSGRARLFGVTAAIHATEDYERTQAWAAAFAEAGFDGVRYRLSQDPRARLNGVALFGGRRRLPRGTTRSILEELVRAAEEAFGIRVMPTPV